jgi:hypothetical protein
MFWTHIYDSILKAGFWLILMLTLLSIPYFEESMMLVLLISTVISIVAYVLFLRTFGSYLYCRFTLKMKVTFQEAKALNEALSPATLRYFDMKWLPLKEVKPLHESKKYAVALKMLNDWTEQRKQKRKEQKDTFKDSPLFIKLLDVLTVVSCVGFLVTSIFNLPPASYVINLYCGLFDTNKYDPMLIGMLMTLVVVLPVLFYKKSKGIKLFF